MSDTICFFRDRLTIDGNLVAKALDGRACRTLVLGAREVELRGLPPDYGLDYVIAADHLVVPPDAPTSLIGEAPKVTVLAVEITGALSISCAGHNGVDLGEPGEGEEPPVEEELPVEGGGRPGRGKPNSKPGRPGGAKGRVGKAGAGGTVTVFYASATHVPTGSAPGGIGRGGVKDGVVDIRQLPAEQVVKSLDAESATEWAAYRAEVAAFLFRKFDAESQLAALHETELALQLNPQDAGAIAIRDLIVNRQVPSGLARDLDIAADFPDLAENLVAEIGLVQGAFGAYQQQLALSALADAVRTNLEAMRGQVMHRQQEARADVVIAQPDIDIAKAEKANLQAEIEQVRRDISAAQERSFGFGDFISTVGKVAVAVAGIATGAGAIVSIPAGIAALNSVMNREQALWYALGAMNNAAKDPKHPTTYEYDVLNAGALAGDLKNLMSGAASVVSFAKLIGDLDAASSREGQAEVARLLKQQATLTRRQMVATLRETQARSRVAVAGLRVQNLGSDIADIQQRLGAWAATDAVVRAATEILIRAARRLMDLVMDDVFLAHRAREIYELDGLPGLRFDYGYLHPDIERSLGAIERGSVVAASLAGLPLQVLSWNQIYQRLNVAQIGFDVIHPSLSLTITDPQQLSAFAGGGVLAFSVGLAELPERMFEVKLNAIAVELRGASSPQSANVWITHSGEWSMKRRTDGSVTAISLRPRSDVLAFRAGNGTLAANLPAHAQSSAERGAPFPFWGRGVATTFRLQLAQPSQMDLSGLSAIHVRLDGLAFAPQGAGAPPNALRITPDVQVLATPAIALARSVGRSRVAVTT